MRLDGEDEGEEPRIDPRAADTPLFRIQGSDAERYAKLWGIDLDDELGRQLFNLEVKFMTLAHSEADIDLEAFAEKWRPATYVESLRALAEDIRREREGRSLRKLGPGFKTIPGGRS